MLSLPQPVPKGRARQPIGGGGLDKTTLPGISAARPGLALFDGRLAIAWAEQSQVGGLQVAIGVPADGPFVASVISLNDTSFSDVALTAFQGRLWLGFTGPDDEVHVLSSPDGVAFDQRIDLGERAAAGVALAADDWRIYAAWTEPAGDHLVVASSADGVTFDIREELPWSSGMTPALAPFVHPYYGEGICLAWAGTNSSLQVATTPRTNLAALAAAGPELTMKTMAGPTVCAWRLLRHQVELTFGFLDPEPDPNFGTVSLVSSDVDARSFGPVEQQSQHVLVMGGHSSPSLVYDGDTLRLAYAAHPDGRVIVGDHDKIFGIPPDLAAKVGQECDPRRCIDDPRLICIVSGETRVQPQPAQIHNARKGHLVLTPADGIGAIGTILKGLEPHQFYDHMGIMVEDQTVIRHCTQSKDRLKDKVYYEGSIAGEPAPTSGLRSDHVRYGWPGPITQTIDDGFFFGNNSGRNPDWDFYTLNPTASRIPPPKPGQADDQAKEFFRRLRFFDPERPSPGDYGITNLTLAPAYRPDYPDSPAPVRALVVRPSRDAEWRFPWVDWLASRIADEAVAIRRGHYRFFAYTHAAIALDPATFAPARGASAWQPLPEGADWPAETPGLVCSSFIWAAAQNATRALQPRIRIGDKIGSPAEQARQQTGTPVFDGLYQYHEDERSRSGDALYEWTVNQARAVVKQNIDKSYPMLARYGVAALTGAVTAGPIAAVALTLGLSQATVAALIEELTVMPENLGNQICMSFALDAPEEVTSKKWREPSTGVAVSPDDILGSWDAPEENPDFRRGPYGASEEAFITPTRTEEVPVGHLALSAGVARVFGRVEFSGEVIVGADVWIGCRHTTTNPDGFQLAVPASDAAHGKQLIRAAAYWEDRPGKAWWLTGELQAELPPGNVKVGALQLKQPPDWRRRVEIHGHLEMVHQVMFGHDTRDRPLFSDTRFVQNNPSWMGRDGYDEAALTRDRSTYYTTHTDVCGGEYAKLWAQIQLMPDLSLSVQCGFVMRPDDDEEPDIVSEQAHLDVPPEGSQTAIIDLKDADLPPDRAHAELTIDNFICPA